MILKKYAIIFSTDWRLVLPLQNLSQLCWNSSPEWKTHLGRWWFVASSTEWCVQVLKDQVRVPLAMKSCILTGAPFQLLLQVAYCHLHGLQNPCCTCKVRRRKGKFPGPIGREEWLVPPLLKSSPKSPGFMAVHVDRHILWWGRGT